MLNFNQVYIYVVSVCACVCCVQVTLRKSFSPEVTDDTNNKMYLKNSKKSVFKAFNKLASV